MIDYQATGLTPNLQSTSSLIAQKTQVIDSMTLEAIYEGFGATKITTGNFRTVVNVGGGANVQIDGENKRIIVNDGTTDRVLIGYQVGGF
jgi:hypothetical protein